jgi:probable addiction module antidote protein
MTTKQAKRQLTIPYEEVRNENLKDWQVTEHYLRLSLQDGLDDFLESLRHVAQAHGMAALARKSGLSRAALYKILSPKGNPQAKSLWQLVEALGMHFELVKEEKKAA